MKLTAYKHHGIDELIQHLRLVTLLPTQENQNPPYVFDTSVIEVKDFPVQDINPTQFYQLPEAIERNKNLQQAFAKEGIDIFKLDGYFTFNVEGDEHEFTLLPPILEEQKQPTGETVAIIADGFHRITLARIEKKENIQTIFISNIPLQYTYPAYPNPRGWDDVIYNEVPVDPAKKRLWSYPIDTAYHHYHYFGSAFPNTGKPRGGNT